MKTNIIILFLMVFGFVSSCDRNEGNNHFYNDPTPSDHSYESEKSSNDNELNSKDGDSSNISNQTDNISDDNINNKIDKTSDNTNTNIEDILEKPSEQEVSEPSSSNDETTNTEPNKNNKFLWLIVFGCLISIVISCVSLIFVIISKKKFEEEAKEQKNKFKEIESELSPLRENLNQLSSKLSSSNKGNNDSLININNRVRDLQTQLNKIQSEPLNERRTNQNQTNEGNREQTGYFGEVCGDNPNQFFRKLLSSNSDDAMFEARIKGNTAIFKPISLDKIKSNDNALRVIRYSGGRQISKSSNMSVTTQGEARRENNIWKIIKYVEVTLS